jgi:hypothetical protein
LPDPVRKELQRVLALRTLLLSNAPPFDQVFGLLKAPGAQPFVGSGYGRYTKELDKIDSFRDNWWCASGSLNMREGEFAPRTRSLGRSVSYHG